MLRQAFFSWCVVLCFVLGTYAHAHAAEHELQLSLLGDVSLGKSEGVRGVGELWVGINDSLWSAINVDVLHIADAKNSPITGASAGFVATLDIFQIVPWAKADFGFVTDFQDNLGPQVGLSLGAYYYFNPNWTIGTYLYGKWMDLDDSPIRGGLGLRLGYVWEL